LHDKSRKTQETFTLYPKTHVGIEKINPNPHQKQENPVPEPKTENSISSSRPIPPIQRVNTRSQIVPVPVIDPIMQKRKCQNADQYKRSQPATTITPQADHNPYTRKPNVLIHLTPHNLPVMMKHVTLRDRGKHNKQQPVCHA
jgi:hypothetical protein